MLPTWWDIQVDQRRTALYFNNFELTGMFLFAFLTKLTGVQFKLHTCLFFSWVNYYKNVSKSPFWRKSHSIWSLHNESNNEPMKAMNNLETGRERKGSSQYTQEPFQLFYYCVVQDNYTFLSTHRKVSI